MEYEPCMLVGLRVFQNIMSKITQEKLSSFHHAGAASMSDNTLLTDIIEKGRTSDICMQTDLIKDPESFKRACIYSRLLDYVVDFESGDRLSDKSSVGLKGKDVILRLYLNYFLLQEHSRDLLYLKNIIERRTSYYVDISSYDFCCILDVIVSQNKPPAISVYDTIKDLELGIAGIRGCHGKTIQGSNFSEIVATGMVDVKTLISNNLLEIQEHFGISGVSAVLDIFFPQFELLISSLIFEGKFTPLNKNHPFLKIMGPMTSLSFERPSGDLSKLFYDPLLDPFNSPNAQIFMGLKAKFGSNSSMFRLKN